MKSGLTGSRPGDGLREWQRIFKGLRYLRSVMGLTALWLVAAILSSVSAALVPQMLGRLTAEIARASSSSQGGNIVAMAYLHWAALAIAALLAGFASRWALARLDIRMAGLLRQDLFEKMLRLEPGFFRENAPGKLSLILTQISAEAQMLYRQMLLDPLNQVISICFALMLIMHNFASLKRGGTFGAEWIGLAAMLILALLSIAVSTRPGRSLSLASTEVRDQNFLVSTFIADTFSAPEEIQALQAESFLSRKFKRVIAELARSRIRQNRAVNGLNLLNAAPVVILQMGLAGLAVWIIRQDITGADVGAIIAILGLVPVLLVPMQTVVGYRVIAANSWPALEAVQEVLAWPETDDGEGTLSSEKAAGTIEFNDVHFAYPGSPPVLDGITFKAESGKIYGLVARMGQGKSTVLRLLLRFYRPDRGMITIDGRDTGTLSLNSVRKAAGYMPQSPGFFHDTVRENLRMARPAADDDFLMNACRRTGIDRILTHRLHGSWKPGQGYLDAPLDASRLSGGERKLFAMTRTLLNEPSILLLDEPTAGMDSLEKQQALVYLRQAFSGRTGLVVEHDIRWLSRLCDEILVLEEGRIVDSGSPAELAERPGLFLELLKASDKESPEKREQAD